MNASKCTAPVTGHRPGSRGAERCPAHRIASAAARTGLRDQVLDLSNHSDRSRAADTETDPKELAELARSDDYAVRQFVAGNPSTPPESLAHLAEEDWVLRAIVAGNHSTSLEVLHSLSGSDEHSTRLGVAGNIAASPEMLARLAADRAWKIRESVAENPSTTPESLRTLSEDDILSVAYAARASIESYICAAFGVDHENDAAVDALAAAEWWALTPESDDVVIAKTLHPDVVRAGGGSDA